MPGLLRRAVQLARPELRRRFIIALRRILTRHAANQVQLPVTAGETVHTAAELQSFCAGKVGLSYAQRWITEIGWHNYAFWMYSLRVNIEGAQVLAGCYQAAGEELVDG